MTQDEIESLVARTTGKINEFRSEPGPETADAAEYSISRMRLALGRQFDALNWFVRAEREIMNFFNKIEKAK